MVESLTLTGTSPLTPPIALWRGGARSGQRSGLFVTPLGPELQSVPLRVTSALQVDSVYEYRSAGHRDILRKGLGVEVQRRVHTDESLHAFQ